jgi:hypothetical protein
MVRCLLSVLTYMVNVGDLVDPCITRVREGMVPHCACILVVS